MIEFLPYFLVALIYAFVAVDFWRQSKHPTAGKSMRWHSLAIAIGLLLHGALLYKSIFIGDEDLIGINFGFATALSLIFWMTVAIYWVTDIKQSYRSLQAFVLPPAAFFVLLHSIREFNVLPYTDQPLFLAHLLIALVAYSLFTFAALHALLMAAAERTMHKQHSFIKLPEFPPLMSMENLLFKVIGLGFLLLTLTLASGMMFSEHIFNQAFKFTHKNIFALLSWLIYGWLLIGRNVYGWRGRKAIRWTLGGFALLLLAYIGSKFVFQFLLRS